MNDFAQLITVFSGVLISVFTERIPIVKKWWREDLDKKYPPEQAKTIRLAIQVGLVVLSAMLAYYALFLGYIPGEPPADDVFIPALVKVILVGVLANQGAYHLNKKV